MALCFAYQERLDLLTHGYVKENIKDVNIPIEIIKLMKLWHSNLEIPKLIFNIIKISEEGDKIALECYLDKPDWGILDIQKYHISYDIAPSSAPNTDSDSDEYAECVYFVQEGEKIITHFYVKEQSLAFVFINSRQPTRMKTCNFTLCAKNSNDKTVNANYINHIYKHGNSEWAVTCDFSLIDIKNKGKITLDEWVLLGDKLDSGFKKKIDNSLWIRIFYFANFMAERNNDYFIDGTYLQLLCEPEYELSEYEIAIDKLRCECDQDWSVI